MHLWIRQSRLVEAGLGALWGMRTSKRVSLLLAAKGPPTNQTSSTINATRTSTTILQLCTSLRFFRECKKTIKISYFAKMRVKGGLKD